MLTDMMRMRQLTRWAGIFLLFALWRDSVAAQEVSSKIIDFEGLKPYLNRKTDSTYVIHFWATWCGPCVEEMPAIGAVARAYADKKVKFLLVSLDMPSMLNSHLIPFLRKHRLFQESVLLDAPDFNSWIDKVAREWQGALPATLVYNAVRRQFFPNALSEQEWEKILHSFIRTSS